MTNKLISVLATGLVLVACTPKNGSEVAGNEAGATQETVSPAPAAAAPSIKKPSKALVDSVSYLLGVNFGAMIKGNNFGDLNYAQLKKGMNDFIKSDGNPYSEGFDDQFRIAPSTMGEIINDYLQQRQAWIGLQNKEQGEKFLASNKGKEGVVETESGLQYVIVEAGDDALKASDRDTVLVRYKGTTLDGKVFDEVTAESEPVRLVMNRVIAGWTEGIQLIGKGGKVKLFIPAQLAYGERGNQGIEPNSTLIFDVEVCDVFKAPEAEAEGDVAK